MYETLSIKELRQKWETEWGIEPHVRIGRTMLEKSLIYKASKHRLSPEQQARLNHLITTYKRNPNFFEKNDGPLKPGTRLIRIYKGQKHSVLVKADSFEYAGQNYKSLSKIANEITGKRWNGWIFFGLKKADSS